MSKSITKGFSEPFALIRLVEESIIRSADEITLAKRSNHKIDIVDRVSLISFPADTDYVYLHHKSLGSGLGLFDLPSYRVGLNFGVPDDAGLIDNVEMFFRDATHVSVAGGSIGIGEITEWNHGEISKKSVVSRLSIGESVIFNIQYMPFKGVRMRLGVHYSVTLDILEKHKEPVSPGDPLNTLFRNKLRHSEAMGVVERVEYEWSAPDSYVYDVKNDAWSQYTNMKIINANVLNGGNALDNVNLLLKNNGEIYQYPSNTMTDSLSIVTTKMLNMEKGAVESLGIIGKDSKWGLGRVLINIGIVEKEDSQVTQHFLKTPIKMRAKNNPIPDDSGYGRTFFAQIKNMISIRNLIFKYKKRINKK